MGAPAPNLHIAQEVTNPTVAMRQLWSTSVERWVRLAHPARQLVA